MGVSGEPSARFVLAVRAVLARLVFSRLAHLGARRKTSVPGGGAKRVVQGGKGGGGKMFNFGTSISDCRVLGKRPCGASDGCLGDGIATAVAKRSRGVRERHELWRRHRRFPAAPRALPSPVTREGLGGGLRGVVGDAGARDQGCWDFRAVRGAEIDLSSTFFLRNCTTAT